MPSQRTTKSRPRTSDPTSGFVRLHLVGLHQLEPSLDKDLMGRFQKALRSVGAAGSVAVRSRMITAVASTKFRTLSGLPVSLVGLHGKDDLLVLGPTWALERLGSGEVPPEPATTEHSDWLVTSRDTVRTEMMCLELLPGLLELVAAQPSVDTPVSDAKRKAAEEVLQALFRTTLPQILAFFQSTDAAAFVEQMAKEAKEVLSDLESQLDQGAESYPIWWTGWEPGSSTGQVQDVQDVLFTESGRHVTAYVVAGAEPERLLRPRSGTLAQRLLEYAAA